jgi:hypothetical protein
MGSLAGLFRKDGLSTDAHLVRNAQWASGFDQSLDILTSR